MHKLRAQKSYFENEKGCGPKRNEINNSSFPTVEKRLLLLSNYAVNAFLKE